MIIRASRKRQILVALALMYMFGVQWMDYMSSSLTVGSHPVLRQWVTLMCLGVPVLYLVRGTLENLIKKEPFAWNLPLAVMLAGSLSLMMEGMISDGAVMLLTVTVAALMLYVVPEKLRADRHTETDTQHDYTLGTPEGRELS